MINPNRNRQWGNGVLPSILLSIILIAMFGCGSDDRSEIATIVRERAQVAVSDLLVGEMVRNRVVMIADNHHGQWQPYQTVINCLDTWFDHVTHDSLGFFTDIRHLVLVLEADTLYLNRKSRYMSTHDPNDLLCVSLMYGNSTTAAMEFYWRLGDLQQRVDAYNKTADSSRLISFSLFAGEAYIDIDNWSREKGGEYYLTVRDSLVADRIAGHAESHPECRYLVYYGAGHFRRGRVTKKAYCKSAEGLFLVSYLDSLFPNQVVSVGQVPPRYWYEHAEAFHWSAADYALRLDHPDSAISAILGGLSHYDAAIVYPRFNEYGTAPIRFPSYNLARIGIDTLPSIMNTANDFNRMDWGVLLQYLPAVAGEPYERIDLMDSASLAAQCAKWQAWLAEAPTDMVPAITSGEVWQRLIDSLAVADESLRDAFESGLLGLLPEAPRVDTTAPPLSAEGRAAQLEEYLDYGREELILDNLIGLLWVGNVEERQSAQEALEAITDTSFATPADWAQWHRDRRYGVVEGRVDLSRLEP